MLEQKIFQIYDQALEKEELLQKYLTDKRIDPDIEQVVKQQFTDFEPLKGFTLQQNLEFVIAQAARENNKMSETEYAEKMIELKDNTEQNIYDAYHKRIEEEREEEAKQGEAVVKEQEDL